MNTNRTPWRVASEKGIEWKDYSEGMSRGEVTRRRNLPKWAANDEKVRAVVYERIRRYCAAQGIHVPKDADAQTLNYLALAARKRYSVSADRLAPESFQSLIATRHLGATEQGVPGYLARMIYCAYRLGLNSVQISEETNRTVSPTQVRQSLYRLNECAAALYPESLPEREKVFSRRVSNVVPDFDSSCESLLRKEILTDEQLALAIEKYRALWDVLECESFDSGRVATVLLGFAEHVGAPEAVKAVQQIVGVKRDGVMSDATIGGINSQNWRSLAKSLLTTAEAHYRSLATRNDGAAKTVKVWLEQLECEG